MPMICPLCNDTMQPGETVRLVPALVRVEARVSDEEKDSGFRAAHAYDCVSLIEVAA